MPDTNKPKIKRPAPRPPRQINNGFWDRPAEERAARMDSACERAGVTNFFDLSPEERARAYDNPASPPENE